MLVDFKDQIRRQLGFIERSCKAYDEGIKEDAIRIATSIRTLMQSGKYPSLLRQMNCENINLLSTCDPALGLLHEIMMGLYQIGPSGAAYIPNLGFGPPVKRPILPLSEWWEQPVMSLGEKITRAQIVKAAANKDGGAHVDTPPKHYRDLAAPGAAGSFIQISKDGEQRSEILDAHFLCLRQMGYELLHSPELVALAE